MIHINQERLTKMLLELGGIGRDANGGITRIAYTPQLEEGAAYVREKMLEAGMQVREDAIGNLIGTLQGETDRVILMGSHIDTVPSGGMFDGALGVLGAIEAVHTLTEIGIRPKHTLMVVAWAEEEGNRVFTSVGCGAFCGTITQLSELNRRKLEAAGKTLEDIRDSRFERIGMIDAALELHIEQGGILEEQGATIGIVQGIFGLHRYETTIFGTSNHAGTTPMYMRDDAMVKAAHLICELDAMVRAADDGTVYTTGWLKAEPGANNIIAGKVRMMVECRSMNEETIRKVRTYLDTRFDKEESHVEENLALAPTGMSQTCMRAIADAAQELGLTTMPVFSGAGHDSETLAKVIPNTGMIFVPSRDGKSHCPDEYTSWEDCAAGADTLLHTVLILDQKQ